MASDGYVEAKNKPSLGECVVPSELTDRKLLEVKDALGIQLSNGSSRIQEQLGNNTPIRRNEPAASWESGVPGNYKRNGVDGRGFINFGKGDDTLRKCAPGKLARRSYP
ncbi:hypothetical protein C5167_030435 [Papaver somniferum]|nr:hypothetical protein C5167_030435 [Papaver somniferum]